MPSWMWTTSTATVRKPLPAEKHFGESYVYAVHDFTNIENPGSRQLSNSEAKVFVYMGQSLVRTYYVPKNRSGNLWTVFRMTGSGDFQDINTFSGVKVEAKDVLNRSQTVAG